MFSASNTPQAREDDLWSDAVWEELYPLLYCIAGRCVRSFRISSWRGQEADLVEDIVQETVRRILERAQRVKRGEASPVYSLPHMMETIARHYCIDLARQDYRLLRTASRSSQLYRLGTEQLHPAEVATERAYYKELFALSAHEIARFPAKQRRVVLVDLADRMFFDEQPTPLQAAFLKEGIDLQEYQQSLSTIPLERKRCATLKSIAYKRFAKLRCVREYVLAV